jgi:hypothetical protein
MSNRWLEALTVSEETSLSRIVDPALVRPAFLGPLALNGTVGFAFSFTLQTSWASSFSPLNLPAGLVIDSETGQIIGMPTSAGTYVDTVRAGNSFGLSTDGLTITVSAPAVVGVVPGEDVNVELEVPEGTPPVDLTFETVDTDGETRLAVIDPETAPGLAPEPPGNFEIVRAACRCTTTSARPPTSAATP